MHFRATTTEGAVLFLIVYGSFVVALVGRGMVRAWVASWLGDRSARDAGQGTPNPLRHFDLIGWIVAPIVCRSTVGWGKEPPIRFDALRNPRRDAVIIAVAGAATSFALAVLSGVMIHRLEASGLLLSSETAKVVVPLTLLMFGGANLELAFFNLVPLPPLDAGIALYPFLTPEQAATLDQFAGHWFARIVYAILASIGYELLAQPRHIVQYWLLPT
jgi:Zn-dependent protease